MGAYTTSFNRCNSNSLVLLEVSFYFWLALNHCRYHMYMYYRPILDFHMICIQCNILKSKSLYFVACNCVSESCLLTHCTYIYTTLRYNHWESFILCLVMFCLPFLFPLFHLFKKNRSIFYSLFMHCYFLSILCHNGFCLVIYVAYLVFRTLSSLLLCFFIFLSFICMVFVILLTLFA